METWKSVVGCEGVYEVSDQGNVRSLDRTTTNGTRLKGKPLKPFNQNGYPAVSIWKGGKKRVVLVQTLVAEAFIGEQPESYSVYQENGDKWDNRLANLRYRWRGEAVREAKRARASGIGENHHSAKLKERDVSEIRRQRGEKTNSQLAQEYGVSETTIGLVQQGRTHSHTYRDSDLGHDQRYRTLDPRYVAGFFDGEGSLTIGVAHPSRHEANKLPSHTFVAGVTQAGERGKSLCWRFQRQYGGGVVQVNSNDGVRQESWQWRIGLSDDVEAFLKEIRPHLILKVDEVDVGIRFVSHVRRHEGVGRGRPSAQMSWEDRWSLRYDLVAERERMRQELKGLRVAKGSTRHDALPDDAEPIET